MKFYTDAFIHFADFCNSNIILTNIVSCLKIMYLLWLLDYMKTPPRSSISYKLY